MVRCRAHAGPACDCGSAASRAVDHTPGCAVAAQEAGIIIHSIFIGLSYGAETDYDTIRALTIALGFHQVRAASGHCSAFVKPTIRYLQLHLCCSSICLRSIGTHVRCCPVCSSAGRPLAAAAVTVLSACPSSAPHLTASDICAAGHRGHLPGVHIP